jgi:hypothetical protein
MPAEVPTGKVEDGAVLAADVLDARGNVLLANGTQLTRAHLSLMERRGIKAVTVRTPEDAAPGSDQPSPEERAARVRELLAAQERVFSKIGEDPLLGAVYRAARAHIEAGNLPPG